MDTVYIGRYDSGEILTGPEKVARRIFDNISRRKKSIFIEYFFDGKKYGLYKKLFGREKIKEINNCIIYRFGIITLIHNLIKVKPKIIHIITFERFAIACFIYKLFFRARIICNFHGLMIYENENFRQQKWFYNYKDKIAEKIFVKYSDVILLLSQNFRNLLGRYYKLNREKIKYIKNGIDVEFHCSEKEVQDDKILKVVFIADITRKEKGFNFLKDTLEKYKKEMELYFVDRKENNIEIENKLIKIFCFDRMSSAELGLFLKDKDIFISASNYEPFGMTSTECMAAGVIPVLSKETGASELIVDGTNGFIYDYGDSEKLIEILDTISGDIELRKRVSEEAIKIYDELNWEKITDSYLNIYESFE